ncbi:hypothetical protein MesoLj113a_65050 [Mesorhizobium sp. 113-1-2]|nr:hypothetical protein MesoLj113a_65050 [Mesorhizobium sp. 113-1-2]
MVLPRHDDDVRAVVMPAAVVVKVAMPPMMAPVAILVDDDRGPVVLPMAMVMAMLVRGQDDRIGRGNRRHGKA